MNHPHRTTRLSYERRVPLLSLLAALPAITVALVLVWTGDFSTRLQWTVTLATVGGWLVFWLALRERLVLANRAGERLIARPEEGMIGRRAASLGLEDLLSGPSRRVADMVFPGAASRWELRVSQFRQEGKPHRLLVVSDLSRVLREEERSAWQRLVRVLGHEINNSLAPMWTRWRRRVET